MKLKQEGKNSKETQEKLFIKKKIKSRQKQTDEDFKRN
jgi:hypothetical protein